MNPTASNTPSVAELARENLEGQPLVAGRPFYSAGGGVVVVIAPLPPEDVIDGMDHELTVSTGFPPNPDAAGLAIWVQRLGPNGSELQRVGETDQFGALTFTPGPPGCEYQLTVARGPTVRLEVADAAVLPFTATTAAHFRRVESRLGADSPGDWVAVEPGPVALSVAPLDSSLCFSFADAPTAVAHTAARTRDGRVVHDVFPLRVGADGRTMEGRLHLPGAGAWEEIAVEALTATVVAELDPAARDIVAARLRTRLQDWGDERPREASAERYRDLWQPLVAALADTTGEGTAPTCPVCRARDDGWAAKLKGLREGLACGLPVCRAHLTGPENTVLAAARDAWHRNIPEVFDACKQLLTDLSDDRGATRRGFLHPYPADLRNQALKQAAGLLSTVISVGNLLKGDSRQALIDAHTAIVALQLAVGIDRTRHEHFVARLATAPAHPLNDLWSSIAGGIGGEWVQGFLAYRHLSASITRRDSDPPPFAPLRAAPVVVRPPLYDRDRGAGVLARVEFLPLAEGCSELYLDLASLGFLVPDSQFLRSLEAGWRAVQPTVSREMPGAAVCVRVTFDDDSSPAPALQGASAGLAVACGLLAVARGDSLDEATAITGELLGVGPGGDFESSGAGWTNRVADKLEAARVRGLRRGVVGIADEGIRSPGKLDREPKPDFEVLAVRTVGEAYRVLRRAP